MPSESQRRTYQEFWGVESLRRLSVQLCYSLQLPASAGDFLSVVGLPKGEQFTVETTLPDVRTSDDDPGAPLILGMDGPVPICLSRAGVGSVETAPFEGQASRYLNRDVECFAYCWTEFERYRQTVRGADLAEDEIQALIDRTEEAMLLIDETAFSDPENYWAVVIEQMRYGHL